MQGIPKTPQFPLNREYWKKKSLSIIMYINIIIKALPNIIKSR